MYALYMIKAIVSALWHCLTVIPEAMQFLAFTATFNTNIFSKQDVNCRDYHENRQAKMLKLV